MVIARVAMFAIPATIKNKYIMIKIVLRNKPNKEGKYPVVLRINKDGKSKIISLGYNCSKDEWSEGRFNKRHRNYNRRNRVLVKIEAKALDIIDEFKLEGKDFSLEEFEGKFRNRGTTQKDVFSFWDDRIKELEKDGKISSAEANKDSLRALRKHVNNDLLDFSDIKYSLLKGFEAELRDRGCNNNTIAFRMRYIRALYNEAIKFRIAKEVDYPFKEYKISKLKCTTIPTYLSPKEIELIENLDTVKHSHLFDAKNYFLFEFYTGGMNFHDLIRLRWIDVSDSRIDYRRGKTQEPISIPILEPIKEILDYYSSKSLSTGYVFPVLLQNGLSPRQFYNRKKKVLNQYNKKLKEIAIIVGIEKDLTSYATRHSFATTLKFKGVSEDIICELMGHSDVRVTRAYLRKFENGITDAAMRKLLEEPDPIYA